MTGFSAFLKKEFRETGKTWRLWVIPGILVVLGLTMPILAAVTPALLRASARSTPGVVIRFPEPVARDAYLQFMGNLIQVVLIALIIVVAAAIAGERRSGTVALVLTKPLSRAAFVLAKAVSQTALVVASTIVGALVCVTVTVAIFDGADIGRFVASVALWLVFAGMMTALMIMLSARLGGQAPAAGACIGAFVVFSVLSGFPVTRAHTPAGLLAAYSPILKGESVALFWPLLTTTVLWALWLVLAVWVFRRREL